MGQTITYQCGCAATWDSTRDTFYIENYCSKHGHFYDLCRELNQEEDD